MTDVSVGAGLPVGISLADVSPYCLTKAVTTPWVEEPTVEKAMVLPLKSWIVLTGEFAFTYQ